MMDQPLGPDDRIDPGSTIPFILMHVACLPALWLSPSRPALCVCLLAYWVRMFGITAGYHRYFSHRSFKTSRPFQFLLAWVGATAAQLGPLWWAAHHRHHHYHSDTEKDVHPPGVRGFLWSHMGWIFCPRHQFTNHKLVKDLGRFPELVWLDKTWLLPPFLLALKIWALGLLLEIFFPQLGTTALEMLVWGFFVSTVACYHLTFCVNSVAHLYGSRRYPTRDESRNNWWLALLTMGEGWHNNHHQYPSSERQGFYWWEVDLTHYLLLGLARIGLVWDLRPAPQLGLCEVDMSLLELVGGALASVSSLMLLLWLWQRQFHNAAIVDVGWTFSLGYLAVYYAALGPGWGPRSWLLAGMVCLWSARLGSYLYWTRIHGQEEEGRYLQLRREWGDNFQANLFWFYQGQAVLDVILSLPFLLVAHNTTAGFSAWETAAVLLFLVALFGEAQADAQLHRFKQEPDNRGKVCEAGLWYYSRHPNYFFQTLLWTSWALFASGSPHGYAALLSPCLILYFVLRVTGIPATEAQAIRSRGEDYRRYQRTTSPLIPWFKRKESL